MTKNENPFLRYFLIVIALLNASMALGEPQSIAIDDRFEEIVLQGPFLTSQEITEQPGLTDFNEEQYWESNIPKKNTYWHRIPLENRLSSEMAKMNVHLMVRSVIIWHIEVALYKNGELHSKAKLGALDDGAVRGLGRPYFSFEMEAGHNYELMVRKQTQGPANLSMTLLNDALLTEKQQSRHIISGAYFFATIVFFCYAILNSLLARNFSSNYYLLFYLYTFSTTALINGFGQYVFPEWIFQKLIVHIQSINIFCIILISILTWHYLDKQTRRNQNLFTISTSISLFLFALSVATDSAGLVILFTLTTLSGGCYIATSCINAMRDNNRAGAFIFLCFITIVVGAAVKVINLAGLIPDNSYTIYAYSIHMMIVTCVITIAITDWVTFSSQRETIQAYRDPLTGLPSYNFLTNGFDTLFQQKIADSEKDAWIYIVTLSSVDRMTRIFGVEAARSIREQYISRLRKSFGSSSSVIEISISQSDSSKLVSIPGGNIGFLVSGNDSNHEIQAILARIEEPFEIFGVRTNVTITAGYAKLYDRKTRSCTDIREAYQKANQALAEAVAAGKPIKEYEETPKSAQSSTLLMASRLSTAIQEKELHIHIQPQYCERRKLSGGEVLMRWNDIELGQVPPSTFIILAEEAGMIFGITRLAIEKSFEWLSQNKGRLPDGFRLSINLSVEDLHNSGLFSVISQCMSTYGPIAYMITFEITETACSSTLDTLREGIKRLKKLGFRVAIDDFGTGYSSIAYLRDISPNTVKIDRTFIQGIDQSDIQRQFVRSIVDMAAAVNANIVSEGIENEMELRTVLELGSDYYQGFYSGRPVPAENFVDTYARHSVVSVEPAETATIA